MTYPESSSVSAGDATLASHYNNLRADSVFLGKAPTAAIPLGTLLERYETRLEIEKLTLNTVRVPATAAVPVSLAVRGYLCQAVANVDLLVGGAPAGAAAPYYVFANRADASTTFTLSVSTSSTEGADQRRIGRFYWDGAKIVKDSVRSELAGYVADILFLIDPQICAGRLTLSTGVPVPVSDIASSATLYFTPYLGNRIALYVQDYGWRLYAFAELTLDVAAIAADKNVDVWIYDNEGTLTLAYTLWSNDTLRATALTLQDGVLVKTGAPTHRYLGTIRTTAAGGLTCDTKLLRFVWNYYNRLEKSLLVTEDTDNWTYVGTAWQALNSSTANRVQFVIGVDEVLVYLMASVYAIHSVAGNLAIGIDLDGVTVNDANLTHGTKGVANPTNQGWFHAYYRGFPGIGFHFLQLLEITSAATANYYGDKASADGELLSGGLGYLMM
ncbi:MAG: hypothetical protein Q7J07_07805 [Pelolinea sp.]|nr:hypothetical protein [Pelolinea sp.]